MKKCLSVFISILFLLTMMPLGALSAVMAEGETPSVVLNVKDFGAVGDGKTDDEAAIWAAFECALLDYMVNDIPVTVYFPEGQYGLANGGLYVYLPRGAGNLTVKGDGADKSTIVYLEEWTNSGSWVALRIYPRITPTSLDEYLHDITIQDLGIYDTDPINHAWHKDKGDPDTEETHGFNIQYCVRATVKNCKVSNVGDEAIDMSHCIDSQMIDNYVENSPGAGSAGGAISVGDGSQNVLVANNTVVGSINVTEKCNWAIAVEALTEHVEGVEIRNNTIRDLAGWGINLGTPNGTMTDVVVRDNDIYHCRDGGIRLNGKGQTTNIQLLNNYIGNVHVGVYLDGSNKVGTRIDGGVIEDLTSYALNVGSTGHRDTVMQNVTIRNAKWRAVYNAGQNTKLDRLYIDGVGTRGDVIDSAIIQYASGGDSAIYNSLIVNCQNKRGIQGLSKVVNTRIVQPEISGYTAMTGVAWIENCWVNRVITIKSGAVVDGLVLYTQADLGTHAIVMSNLTDCTITNCRLTMPSRYGISEAGTANNNVITGNVCVGGSGVKVVGADTVATDNVRSTLTAGEQFTYRVVDGAVTVMAPVDPALTAVEIPATIEGYPVVAIDPWAFALCEALQSVSFPESVTTIGDYAFMGCTGLTAVNYGGLEPQRPHLILGAENEALNHASWTYHWENHDYDNDCDPDCNGCDFVREVGEHVYDNACDAACNSCGILREVPDHIYDVVVTTPDCVSDGCTTYTCTVCGDSYVTDVVAALGHDYDVVVTTPDCVSGGYTTYTCTVCGDRYVTDVVAALGHDYDVVVTTPDCVSGGYTTYTCTVCGDSYVADEVVALGHDYEIVVTTPDCVNGGYTTYTCTVCGDKYVTDETAARGHSYDNACDAACNTCGAVRQVPDHVYDGDSDTDCNECGFVRVVVTPGDANNDGKINNRDLGVLQQYLNGVDLSGKTFDVLAADVNGDGKVNNRDLGMLQKMLNQ